MRLVATRGAIGIIAPKRGSTPKAHGCLTRISMATELPTGTVPPPPEVIEVETTTVGCDGGGGALGHPLIYIPVGRDRTGECGSCARKFLLTAGIRPSQH